LLCDDHTREQGKIDIMVIEEDLKAWAFEVGNVWLQFVERDGRLYIAHLQARPPRIG
jgi:hypothetical protein